MCMHAHDVYVQAHMSQHMWRPEDSFVNLILFFHLLMGSFNSGCQVRQMPLPDGHLIALIEAFKFHVIPFISQNYFLCLWSLHKVHTCAYLSKCFTPNSFKVASFTLRSVISFELIIGQCSALNDMSPIVSDI